MARPRCGRSYSSTRRAQKRSSSGWSHRHVRLLVEVDAACEPLLQGQRLPDLLEQSAARARRQLALLQRLRDGVDALEGDGNAPLVVGERHAHRQRLGDQQQPVAVRRFDLQGARGRNEVVVVGLHEEADALRLALGERRHDARLQAADQLLLLDRGHADEDGRARLEQDGHAVAGRAERQGRARERVVALQTLDLDALAELQGPNVDFLGAHAPSRPLGGTRKAALQRLVNGGQPLYKPAHLTRGPRARRTESPARRSGGPLPYQGSALLQGLAED